jgi:ribonuclease J
VIHTVDGSIVYAPDFTFTNSTDHKYRTSLNNLTRVGEEKVLALLSESLGTNTVDGVSTDYYMEHVIQEALDKNTRIIFSMFSNELQRLQKVINLSIAAGRKIAIMGAKTQKTIGIAIATKNIVIPEDKIVRLSIVDQGGSFEYDPNLVIIVPGMRHEPYYMLQRMCDGKDRLVNITKDDQVVIISPLFPGIEKMASKTMDVLSRNEINVIEIKKGNLRNYHADSEDLKMMYDILTPVYIIPIMGEFRHQYRQRQIAQEAGYQETNIIMMENGEAITFKDGISTGSRSKTRIGEFLLDGNSISNDVMNDESGVIRERENLADNGIIIISVDVVDQRGNLSIVSGPRCITKGFIAPVDVKGTLDNQLCLIAKQIIEKDRKSVV